MSILLLDEKKEKCHARSIGMFVWISVHHKLAPPLDVSCRFLQSYLDFLIGMSIELNCNIDRCKGKMILSYDLAAKYSCSTPSSEVPGAFFRGVVSPDWCSRKRGWVKPNSDGVLCLGQRGRCQHDFLEWSNGHCLIDVHGIALLSECFGGVIVRMYGRSIHCYPKEWCHYHHWDGLAHFGCNAWELWGGCEGN